MARRPFRSGASIETRRSNRPERSRAGSRTSGRLVAAITTTAQSVLNPSISTNNWFRVCSRSSLVRTCEPPRRRPSASISSRKTMQGAFFLACRKRSRTRAAPTPTNISTKSEPLIEKYGTLASPATARESRVLPVPGGPTKSTPRGIRAPSSLKDDGVRRNWTTSSSSCLASSTPTTSAKVTWPPSGWRASPRCLVKAPMGLPSRLPRRRRRNRRLSRTSRPRMFGSIVPKLVSSVACTVTFTPCWRSCSSVTDIEESFSTVQDLRPA